MATTMQAWQIAAPGTIEESLNLINDAVKPSPPLQKGQILVQVVSAGLNPADYKTVQMGFLSRAILSFPKTPGMDLSGRVVAAADDVADVKAGDVVLVRLDPTKAPGALSQYVVAEREGYAVLPPDFDMDVAAGAPTTALTAYQTMKPYVEKGSKVFINGGSGGVGTFGIQIGKALGCYVAVSCSTKKKDLCEKLGADEVFDYTAGDLATQLKQSGNVFDLVVDNVGSSLPGLYQQSKHFLKPEGAYVLVGGSASLNSAKNVAMAKFVPSFLGGGRNKLVTYITSNSHDDLAQIAEWLGEGAVRTIIDRTFEFEEAAQAFAHLKKGSGGGKVIVHVSKRA